MTGDPLKKVQAGDPLRIKAETFNTFIDAAIDYKNRSRNLSTGTSRDAADQDIVLVKNKHGYPLVRFTPVGLGDPVILPGENIDEFKSRVAFDSDPSNLVDGKYAIMLDSVPPDAIGRAVASGVVQVRLAVRDENHDRVTVASGLLESSFSGCASILWKADRDPEHPDDPRWAIIRLSNLTATDVLVEITESDPYQMLDDGSTARPIAIYREADDPPMVECVVLSADECGAFERTDTVLRARKHLLNGVHWTGQRVWLRQVGGCYEIVSPGVYLWSNAVSQEAFFGLGKVELFEDGPIVDAISLTSIAEATPCMVLFDDERQKFVIFAQSCPPEPLQETS